MLGRGTRVYLQKMKIYGGSLKMRTNTQANPSKIRGRSLRCYSEFKCRVRKRTELLSLEIISLSRWFKYAMRKTPSLPNLYPYIERGARTQLPRHLEGATFSTGATWLLVMTLSQARNPRPCRRTSLLVHCLMASCYTPSPKSRGSSRMPS